MVFQPDSDEKIKVTGSQKKRVIAYRIFLVLFAFYILYLTFIHGTNMDVMHLWKRAFKHHIELPEVTFSEVDLTSNWMKWISGEYISTWRNEEARPGFWVAGDNDIVPPGFYAITQKSSFEGKLLAGTKVEKGKSYMLLPVFSGEEDESAEALEKLLEKYLDSFFKSDVISWSDEDVCMYYRIQKLQLVIGEAQKFASTDEGRALLGHIGFSPSVSSTLNQLARRYSRLRIRQKDVENFFVVSIGNRRLEQKASSSE